jgi:predicted dehydrogenase
MSDATRPVRWGILGAARIATKVGAAIRQADGAELTLIASRDAERAAAWAAEHGALRSCGSYQAVLDDPEIDAVYIPLPPSMHREWTILAAEHGKHVLCEKPLALSSAEVLEMIAACRQNGVQLMDGVMWLHHPRTADMLRAIHSGELGTLRRVTSAFSFCWPELPQNEIRLERKYGGGSLLDLGWYNVGATLWALGERPRRVSGSARWHRAGDVDMHFAGLMWFDDEDRTASFDCGFDTVARRWLEVAGTEGSLVCDDFVVPWQPEKLRFWTHDSQGSATQHTAPAPIQQVCMIEDFVRLVRSGRLDEHWPQFALAVQRICEALDRSARTERPVDIAWP